MNLSKGMNRKIFYRLFMNFRRNCLIACSHTCLHWRCRYCRKTCHLISGMTLNLSMVPTKSVENVEGWEERHGILNTAWRTLYKVRWAGHGYQNQVDVCFSKNDKAKCDSLDDWQQIYWEAHLQECIDAVAETASLPSFAGSIGEIQIPGYMLDCIGCSHQVQLKHDYLKFFYHCQRFGTYARNLRLQNALCVVETCHLLQSSKLEGLELQWIKSNDHVEGLCKLLNQNNETLKSIEFFHCKLSPTFVNAICESLNLKGLQVHGIEHFLIKRSSFLQPNSSPIPVGLASFLKSGRSLCSVALCDDHLGQNFTRVIFNSLLNVSSTISILDVSENNISGFLSQFRWRSSNFSLGEARSLPLLRVLNLRNCNLAKDDADCLRQALVHMPNLENLDLSDNSIEEGIRSLLPYFTEISRRDVPFLVLKLESCELSYNHVTELFAVLSTMKTPLNLLSIKGNSVGRKIGAPLGKFICSGIRGIDVEDIGLRSSGFADALNEITHELQLVSINISNNQGGIEAAKFLLRLFSYAHEISAIDARYNIMPTESLSLIFSGLKACKGKLKHLDLAGNVFGDRLAAAEALLSEIQISGELAVNLSSSVARNVPYDDEP